MKLFLIMDDQLHTISGGVQGWFIYFATAQRILGHFLFSQDFAWEQALRAWREGNMCAFIWFSEGTTSKVLRARMNNLLPELLLILAYGACTVTEEE